MTQGDMRRNDSLPSSALLAMAISVIGFVQTARCQQYDITTVLGPIGSVATGYFDYNGDGTSTLMNGSGTVYMAAIGFNLTAIDGNPVSESHIGFCMELEQPIAGNTSYTFDLRDDPADFRGGLTAAQVGHLSYLFDNYYAGPNLADWGTTSGIRNEYIFQLSLWEITHDTDLSLLNPSGKLYFTGAPPATAVSEAQSILTGISSSSLDFSTYQSANWDIKGLANDIDQNLVYAEAVPEPSSALLLMVGAMFILLIRRPRAVRRQSCG
jgi:hypothetical protein